MFDSNKLDSFFQQNPPQSGENQRKNPITRHTQTVRWAKLLLPSFAAILLGVLAVYPSLEKSGKEFKFAITRPRKGELEKLHISNTVFNITDKDNQVNNFTAESIDETQAGSKLIKMTHPEGIIPYKDGEWIDIKSPVGYYNQAENTLHLDEDVELFYSSGMTLNADDVIFDFKQSRGSSDKPVKAQGIFGDLDSQGFEIYHKKGILIFNGKTNITIKEKSFKGK